MPHRIHRLPDGRRARHAGPIRAGLPGPVTLPPLPAALRAPEARP